MTRPKSPHERSSPRANTLVDWSRQRYWDDVNEGDEIDEVQYPLTVCEYIGLAGTIKQTGPFRMRIFSTVGDTVVVGGKVARKYTESNETLVELEIQSLLASNGNVSVGTGPVTVTLPTRSSLAANPGRNHLEREARERRSRSIASSALVQTNSASRSSPMPR